MRFSTSSFVVALALIPAIVKALPDCLADCAAQCETPDGDVCTNDCTDLKSTCKWLTNNCGVFAYEKWPTMCSGVCFSSDSTVSLLNADGSKELVPVAEIKEGHHILSLDANNKPTFAKVMGVRASPAREPYVLVGVEGLGPDAVVKATKHHLFPTCSLDGTVMAKDLAKGSCVATVTGGQLVTSVNHVAPKPGDKTYTLEMEKNVNLVNVGGVFTHAFSVADAPPVTSGLNASVMWVPTKANKAN
jgi:hypothetical protein